MKTHDFQQGSPEWHAHRATHFNASDAPAMMGCSPYMTRTELMVRLKTGIVADVDPATQRRFDDGHRFEALARPLAEKIIGEELYPVTGSEGELSASFDGLTLMEDVAFEHKTLNDELRAVMVEGRTGADLPLLYRVQMEQQHMVSGCKKVLFVASKWRGEELVEERHCWYTPDPALRAQIKSGWKQLAEELPTFVPPAPDAPTPTGKAPETLPALHIVLKGEVSASNLDEFKEVALAAIRSVNRDLQTDQDFADSAKARKWCEDIETKVAAAKQHALSQTATIDALFRALDEISDEAAKVRKELKKLEEARTLGINGEVVADGVKQFADHMRALNAAMPAPYMPSIPTDFGGAIKNLRTVASKKNAVATELARAKIAANEVSTRIQANLRTLEQHIEHALLFPDVGILVLKQPDDLAAVISQRVAAHEAELKRKADAVEAQRKADDAIKVAATPAPAAPAPAPAPVAAPAATPAAAPSFIPVRRAAAPAPVAGEKPSMNLGAINARLGGISVTAEFLAELGFVAHVERSSKLYKPSAFPAICEALIQHLTTVADGVVA
jgi:putative phage-type endonuclease